MSNRKEAEAAVVQAFNNLPRHEFTPSGQPNHWYFTVRHVDLNPPGDLVHIVHPISHIIHCAGPAQVLSLPSLGAKADAIVPLLLDSFIQGIPIDPNEKKPMEPFAPWTWGTKDPELAKAIEKKLQEVGVRKELCSVHLGNKEQDNISDVTWDGFMDTLRKRALGQDENSENTSTSSGIGIDINICATCKKDKNSFPHPLKKCSRCGGPRYCSQECQKADWKQHKRVCKPASATKTQSTDPFKYYNNVAHGVSEAQKLAQSVNLTLPTERDNPDGLVKPIRRLIVTGTDTPDNLEILLGPAWKSQSSMHEELRLHVLINPPPGSSSYALYSKFDEGSPKWSPRPADDEEKEKLQEVRDMQAAIKSHLGSRAEPTTQDMQAIIAGMGQEWTKSLPIYEIAVNTINRGISAV